MKSCFWILYILSRFSYDLSSCLKYIWSYISKDENTILLLITSIWWTNCCCYHHHHFVKQKKNHHHHPHPFRFSCEHWPICYYCTKHNNTKLYQNPMCYTSTFEYIKFKDGRYEKYMWNKETLPPCYIHIKYLLLHYIFDLITLLIPSKITLLIL